MLVPERVRRDARRFIARLTDGWREYAREVERALERAKRWEYGAEWRIGTVTEERIEQRDGRFALESRCDVRFAGEFSRLEHVLVARSVFWRLHEKLFYAFGWPSWAGFMRSEPSDSWPASRADDADRYLARVHDETLSRYSPRIGEIQRSIAESGRWRAGPTQIETEERWPDVLDEATERVYPELWFGTVVTHAPIAAAWRSPTVERAIEYAGVVERLASDLVAVLGWAE